MAVGPLWKGSVFCGPPFANTDLQQLDVLVLVFCVCAALVPVGLELGLGTGTHFLVGFVGDSLLRPSGISHSVV